MNFLAVIPHSAAIIRSQYQNAGSFSLLASRGSPCHTCTAVGWASWARQSKSSSVILPAVQMGTEPALNRNGDRRPYGLGAHKGRTTAAARAATRRAHRRSSFSRMPSIARRLRSTHGEIVPCARHVVGHRDRDRIDAPGICSGCRWQPH